MPSKSACKIEVCRRFLPAALSGVKLQKRADASAPHLIDGYGAVFYRAGDAGTEFDLGYGIVERIMPGAFDDTLQADDIRSTFNHDVSALLGRTSSETLRLSVDDVGLKYEIDAPDTQCGRDVVELLTRGDVDGSSIWFVPTRVVWIEETDIDIRQIEAVRLVEVGPVSWPAYTSTTAGARNNNSGGDLAAIVQERDARRQESDRVHFKARMAAFDARQ